MNVSNNNNNKYNRVPFTILSYSKRKRKTTTNRVLFINEYEIFFFCRFLAFYFGSSWGTSCCITVIIRVLRLGFPSFFFVFIIRQMNYIWNLFTNTTNHIEYDIIMFHPSFLQYNQGKNGDSKSDSTQDIHVFVKAGIYIPFITMMYLHVAVYFNAFQWRIYNYLIFCFNI